jgi:hypothetical protein
MTLFAVVPWFLCASVYCLLHVTYPRDKRRKGCSAAPWPEEEQDGVAVRGGSTSTKLAPVEAEDFEAAVELMEPGIRSID